MITDIVNAFLGILTLALMMLALGVSVLIFGFVYNLYQIFKIWAFNNGYTITDATNLKNYTKLFKRTNK
jgi:hypothetical protein